MLLDISPDWIHAFSATTADPPQEDKTPKCPMRCMKSDGGASTSAKDRFGQISTQIRREKRKAFND